jgi:hypothetical protein
MPMSLVCKELSGCGLDMRFLGGNGKKKAKPEAIVQRQQQIPFGDDNQKGMQQQRQRQRQKATIASTAKQGLVVFALGVG